MLRRGIPPAALCLAALAVASCQSPASDGSPEVPVSFLRERVREVLDDVTRARAALGQDPAEASARLSDSHLKLRQLDEYYLPLLAARQQVGAALGAVDAGGGSARSAVDSAEAVLMGIVRSHGRHLEQEMRGSLGRLEDARTALAAGDTEEVRRILQKLGSHLESIVFRGDLVLEGSELDPE